MLNKILRFLFSRVVIVSLSLLAQLGILLVMVFRFEQVYPYLYVFSIILNTVIIISLISRKSDPAYKIAWIIPLTAVPVFGGLLYVVFGRNSLSDRQRKKMVSLAARHTEAMGSGASVDELMEKDPASGVQSRYILRSSYAPAYKGTSAEYLPLGEVKFARMLEELEKAEHYIFLEYFIIGEGVNGKAHSLTFLHTTDVCLINISDNSHVGKVLCDSEELRGVKRCCYRHG